MDNYLKARNAAVLFALGLLSIGRAASAVTFSTREVKLDAFGTNSAFSTDCTTASTGICSIQINAPGHVTLLGKVTVETGALGASAMQADFSQQVRNPDSSVCAPASGGIALSNGRQTIVASIVGKFCMGVDFGLFNTFSGTYQIDGQASGVSMSVGLANGTGTFAFDYDTALQNLVVNATGNAVLTH